MDGSRRRVPELMARSAARTGSGIDRRDFIVLASSGLALGFAAQQAEAKAMKSAAETGLSQRFLSIDGQGRVTVYAKHLDMGQGIWSGLASIVAEELDADWATVHVEGAPARVPDYAHTTYGAQTTGGSTSIANSWDQLRQAGAVARRMLVQAAAAAWRVPENAISIRHGILESGNRKAGFGDFAPAAGRLPLPKATPKPRSEYRLLGKQHLRQLDAAAKSTGRQRFAIDGGWPDLKVALIARSPRIGGTLAGFDKQAALAIPGVREVAVVPAGVAVIADTTWQALKAREALNVQWDNRKASLSDSNEMMAELSRMMSEAEPDHREDRGDPDAAFAGAHTIVEANFEFPFLAHAPMEPLCVMGRIENGRCFLRGGFQSQTANQQAVADILSMPTDHVMLETIPAGGSFGRRASADSDWVAELAHVLRATMGRWAIKLMHTREDDMAALHYRPQARHHLRGALDTKGKLVALDHAIAGEGVFPHLLAALPDLHRSSVTHGNAFEQYYCADARVSWWRPAIDVSVETYRGISNNHTCVAKEVFIDRLARAAQIDPVAFRLGLLEKKPRLRNVLTMAAKAIDWDVPAPAGRTRGLAVHEADSSFVAQIVEVSGTAEVYRIERVVCVIDVGLPLNPDILRAQVEGGIGFALSTTMYSSITITDGAPVESNFDTYRILRINEMPRSIEVHIVDSNQPPTGIGEPASVLAAAATINALERIGARQITRFPFAQ